MAPSLPGRRRMCWLVVLFAVATLLGHVCALQPGDPHLADASAGIGSAGPDFGRPVTIDQASCESLKPASAWPAMRANDSRPAPGRAVPDSTGAGRPATVPVPRLPLFVLHAALLI